MHSVEKAFFHRITKAYPKLSEKKKRVADFVLQDYKRISLMTAKELAAQCRVSEPTIIRFAVNIGFSGYLEFVRHVKDMVQMELSSVDRLFNATQQSDEATTLEKYCKNAINNLENLMESVSSTELQTIARAIYHAQNVYVVGYRASAVPASYFGYFLKRIRENVMIDTRLAWEINDSIAQTAETSIIFVITFQRYPRKIIEFLEYAKKFNVKIISLSDSFISPVINLSDQYVVINLKGVSFVDPAAHVITYLGSLIHEITVIDTEKAMKFLKKFEEQVKIGNEFMVNDSTPLWMPAPNNPKKMGGKGK